MLNSPHAYVPHLATVDDEFRSALNCGFTYFSCKPNTYLSPDKAAAANKEILATAIVPGTVGMLAHPPHVLAELDAYDHWYFKSFEKPNHLAQTVFIQFDGLLTIADVYLNGELILQSTNAFHVHKVDITHYLQANNQLAICFKALKPVYSAKHPRPKYITRLINERNLRFIRTPVLGYTPGFSSTTKPVGPYRPITLISTNVCTVNNVKVVPQLIGDKTGQLDLNLQIKWQHPLAPEKAVLSIIDTDNSATIATKATSLQILKSPFFQINDQILLNAINAYWPHTHGQPKRYRVEITVENAQISHTITLGDYGFKRVERVSNNCFTLKFNGQSIYFRGACWTPADPISLHSSKESLYKRLTLLQQAGINMLRVPGNMLYENDDFYAHCDTLGILVFQDFAFSNFDYPDTPEWLASVSAEIETFLSKHGAKACLTVTCGGSEVAQQAGMMGVPLNAISHPLFTTHIPAIVNQWAPHIPYAASSPYADNGLPFHAGNGPSQYFGVGGYLRSLEDARLFKGRFITECLPFSHVPEEESLRQFWGGVIHPSHHPLWKDGVTRDPGSGWDFSDITDYYMQQRFNVNPVNLRSINPERYRTFCRATVVDMVESTLSIFRADSATGRAALVWNLNDLKPGAGWGYIDSLGKPKSAFYALARTAQPTTLLFVDEGLEGLNIFAAHDAPHSLNCILSVSLITEDGKPFAECANNLELPSCSVTKFNVDTLIGHFVDASYAYRFGPRAFTACIAKLTTLDGKPIAQKVFISPSESHLLQQDLGLQVMAVKQENGHIKISCSTQLPAYFVHLELDNFHLSDNYFHVMPNHPYQIEARALFDEAVLEGRVRALNFKNSVAIKMN
jgi:beta-mannosidase